MSDDDKTHCVHWWDNKRSPCCRCGYNGQRETPCPGRTLPKRGDAFVPGERSTSEYSPLAIAVALDRGLLRVDRDGLGWISGMEPDRPTKENR
jgi:hypothetical protein